MRRHRGSFALYVLLSVTIAACRDDQIGGPVPPSSPAFSAGAQDGAIPALQDLIADVPAVRANKESLPDDLTDSELISAVAAAGGIVHIGFKPATEPRTKDSGIFPAMTRAQFAEARNGVVALGARTVRSYRGMASIVAQIPPDLAPVIRKLPVINYLEPEGAALTQSTQDTSWGARKIRAPQAWSPLGFRGDFVNIVILDSGADPTHRFTFNGDGPANLGANCYYIDPTFASCDDDTGHGSHVSGIAAARDNNAGYIGVAHEPATTSMVKVCGIIDGYPSCPYNAVRAGLDWAATNGRPRQVINMSLGGCQNNSGMYEAVVRAKAAGALLVAAAGNTNPGDCLPNVLYPAKYVEVIAVSGTLEDDSFAPSSFVCPERGYVAGSRYGPEVELSAPFYARSMYLGGTYRNECGTSMAAPVATAVAALIWGKLPSWTADQVRSHLQQIGRVDLGARGRDDYFGYGRVDALLAVLDPFSVSISGPTEVYEYDTSTWNATSTGGFVSVAYSWQVIVNGGIVHTATGSSMSYTNRGYSTDGPSFTVRVEASDGAGRTTSNFQNVAVLLCNDPSIPC